MTAIAASSMSSCAVLREGTVWCWGSDEGGEIGWPAPKKRNAQYRTIPTRVAQVTDAVDVAVTRGTGCAVISDGTVRCWGGGYFEARKLAGAVAGLTSVTSVSLHKELACALRKDGSVWCWRESSRADRAPQAVTGLSRVEHLWLASDLCWEKCRVCVQSAQELRCGTIDLAGLGSGQPFSGLEPSPLGRVRSMAFGLNQSCAALAAGSVRCWPNSSSPTQEAVVADAGAGSPGWLTEIAQAEQVALAEPAFGGKATLCARLADGTARCGPLGEDERAPKPVAVTGVTELVGGGHFCALGAEGTVRCWGRNGSGQLGDGTRVPHAEPMPVTW